MICEWKDGRMPARTERYLPERIHSFGLANDFLPECIRSGGRSVGRFVI